MRPNSFNLICILVLFFLIQMSIPPIEAADQYGGTLLTTGNTIDDTGENFNYLFDNGNAQWIYKLKNDEYCEAVAISGNGQYIALISRNIQVSPNTCHLWLFNNRGEILWHFDTCVDKIAISADGNYIVALKGNTIYLINHEGKLLWTSEQYKLISGDWRSSIKISSDGQRIICTDGNTIITLDHNGKTIASFERGYSYTPLSISSDGQYIVTTGDCVDPTKDRWETQFTKGVCMYNYKGDLLWAYDIDTQTLRNPAISADGKTIAIITESPLYEIHLLNREGILQATIPYTGVGTPASVAISSDGQVITIWDGPNFVMVDHTGKVLSDFSTIHSPFNVVNYYNTASISSDSHFVAVIDGFRLYFFQNDLPIQSLISPITTITTVPPSLMTTKTTGTPLTIISTPDTEVPTTRTIVEEGENQVAVNFYGTPLSGTVPLTVQFSDQSTGNPTSWEWSFGDNDQTNSTMRNPIHTYRKSGKYSISLKIMNRESSDFRSRVAYIEVKEPAKRPVLFVHGLDDTVENVKSKPIYSALIKDHNVSLIDYSEGPKNAYGDIREYSKYLDTKINEIKKETGSDKVDIVAHSMGGLISRYRIQKISNNKDDVGKLIMIGTPNHGSEWSTAFKHCLNPFNYEYCISHIFNNEYNKDDPYQAINAMYPGSIFLNELNGNQYTSDDVAKGGVVDIISNKAQYFVIAGKNFSDGDGFVSFYSAKLSNVPIYPVSALHWEQFDKQEVIDKVIELLDQPDNMASGGSW